MPSVPLDDIPSNINLISMIENMTPLGEIFCLRF